MAHSKVYQHIHFLLHLKDASVAERRNMLVNITRGQFEALHEVIVRIVNGMISPMRRDAQLFHHRRTLLRTLSSNHVSFRRKKTLLKRYHSLLPVLLRVPYLIQVIIDETM